MKTEMPHFVGKNNISLERIICHFETNCYIFIMISQLFEEINLFHGSTKRLLAIG